MNVTLFQAYAGEDGADHGAAMAPIIATAKDSECREIIMFSTLLRPLPLCQPAAQFIVPDMMVGARREPKTQEAEQGQQLTTVNVV